MKNAYTETRMPLPFVGTSLTEHPRDLCANCSARGICWSSHLHNREIAPFAGGQPVRSVVKRGAYLCRANSDLKSLFAVHSGSLKSSLVDEAGREQIVGYHIGRDLLGLEGIDTGKHVCDVVALEDTEVCKIPFATLQKLCATLPELQSNLHRTMGREIGRSYAAMHALSVPSSLVRVAAFLRGLAQRYAESGESGTHFKLYMTRHEIASLLGLELETVSRAFSRLRDAQIISVCGRNIEIKSLERLQAVM